MENSNWNGEFQTGIRSFKLEWRVQYWNLDFQNGMESFKLELLKVGPIILKKKTFFHHRVYVFNMQDAAVGTQHPLAFRHYVTGLDSYSIDGHSV